MAELEKAGIPTTALVAQTFLSDWKQSCRVFGVEGIPFSVIPAPLVTLQSDEIRAVTEDALEDWMRGLTQPVPEEQEPEIEVRPADVITIKGEDRLEAL